MWFTVLMTIHQKPEKSVVYHIETVGGQHADGSGTKGPVYSAVRGVYKDGERRNNLLMDPATVFVEPLGNMPSNTQTPTNKIDAKAAAFDERGMCFMDTGLQDVVGNNLPYFILFSRGRCYLRALSISNLSDVSFTVSFVDVSIKSDSATADPKWAYPLSPGTAKMPHATRRTVGILETLFLQHGRYTAIVAAMSLMILWRCIRPHMRRRDDAPVHQTNPLHDWLPYSLCIGSAGMSSTLGKLVGMIGCIAWYVQTRLHDR